MALAPVEHTETAAITLSDILSMEFNSQSLSLLQVDEFFIRYTLFERDQNGNVIPNLKSLLLRP